MKKEMTAQAGPDGLLNLTVPLGQKGANKTVRVLVETVENAAAYQPMSQDDWTRFVQRMAGCISDPSFARQPQGEYEQREELT